MNETRKLILKVLLTCLAIAAGTGVLAVLSASDALAKVTGTAALASGAALLMLALSVRLDKPITANAGIVGMVIVVIEFLLALALIWEIPPALGFSRSEEPFYITCWLLLPFGVGLMIAMRLLAAPFTKIAGVAALAIVSFGLISSLLAAWLPGPFYTHDRWWGMAWAVSGIGIAAVMSLVGAGTPVLYWSGDKPEPAGSLRPWRWVGVAASAIAVAIALYSIWFSTGGNPTLLTIIIVLGFFVGFANVVTLAPLKPQHRWLGVGTLAGGAVTAILTIFLAVSDFNHYGSNEWLERMLAAAVIPTACGSLALLVLIRITRKSEFAVSQSKELRITLVCPRCRRKQDLALGGAACEGCGLKIEVKVEEPRCTRCGYLLYMLTGNVCPECGASIESPSGEGVTAAPV